MKSKYLFSLTLYFFSSCSAQTENNLVVKEFPKFGVKVSLPENWTYLEGSENMKNKLFKCFFKEDGNTTPYNTIGVSISYQVMDKPENPDTLFAELSQAQKSESSYKDLKEDTSIIIASLPTKTFQYSYSINDLNLTGIDSYFIHGKILFYYTATVLTDKLEAYKKRIAEIGNSIQVGKTDPSVFTNSLEYKKIESKYVSEKYGFEIDFPKGWFYIEEIMGNAVQVKKSNQDASETISMGVNVKDLEDETTAKEFNQSILTSLKKTKVIGNTNDEIPINKFKHKTLDAYKSSFTANFNGKEQICFLYTATKDNKGFMFMTTTDPNHQSDNEKLFDSIFETMRIK